MADGGNWLSSLHEVLGYGGDSLVQGEVLWGSPAGDDEPVVACRVQALEGCVEGEVVPGLFAVRLVTFEVVNGRRAGFAGPLVGADCVDLATDGLESLKWNHHLVVLHEILRENEFRVSSDRIDD